MGVPKLVQRYRRFCDDYKVEYAIEGTVEDFDTLYPVPPERLVRGIDIRVGNDVRLVAFHQKQPPITIEERVIVIGRDVRFDENAILPAMIFSPEHQQVLFSENLQDFSKSFAKTYAVSALCGIFLILGALWLGFWYNPVINIILTLFLVPWCFSETLYTEYHKRPRTFTCDNETWQALAQEVDERFRISLIKEA